jgi:hypothetical protein
MKDKLTTAIHVTAKYSPWVTLASTAAIIAIDLRSKKN